MKFGFILLSLLIIGNSSFAQGYLDDIAIKACDCLNTVSDTVDREQFQMKLGICMIEAASPYKKQLKRDHNIDFNNIRNQSKELGTIIGLRMLPFCSAALMEMANKVNANKQVENANNVFEGQVINIDESQFLVFSVKDNSSKISKFYWLTFIESETELTSEYKSFLDKPVIITYKTQEYFDPKIGEYRSFNIIQKLKIVSK